MKTSIAIAALLSSATTFALELPAATISPALWIPEATPTPLSGQLGEGEAQELEPRQATVHNIAPVAPTQAPTVTTNWLPTYINGVTTYVPVVYTQTFPSEYMPYPAPLSGQIGLGTLTKEKRDAAPQPTGNDHGLAGRIRIA
ncbi:hypothetical protein AMS68_001198 [Peltaster fructicola]|uniref:Yeast cell wall synthesis Kre9/Knh1 C-terminal domain-containing protein n=1 Tax=Peltaster fructicola TaxID=286661 RepID=A0A6H0XM14_9PEZI|nr:hypothetical protein AMS68_001198 [Peltaster fructicola]